MAEVRWIPLAEVARPHGVRGEVRLKVYNADSELLFTLREVLVRPHNGKERIMKIDSVRGADTGYLLAQFHGIDSRDGADGLRGASIYVERARFPDLEEGEFYVCDVIGARLVGPSGEVGVVENLVSYPSSDVLVVRLGAAGEGAQSVEVPLVDDFIERVDTDSHLVVLRSAALEWLSEAVVKNHAN